jgi:hypothetical protein
VLWLDCSKYRPPWVVQQRWSPPKLGISILRCLLVLRPLLDCSKQDGSRDLRHPRVRGVAGLDFTHSHACQSEKSSLGYGLGYYRHTTTGLVRFSSCLCSRSVDVLRAATPPSVAYFKTLPTYVTKCLAVYLLVLEKPSSRPKIYIGSGTHVTRGVRARLHQYDAKTWLSQYVKQALDDGYMIMHKGLLCWCPIPAAAKIFPVRALLMVIEAAFATVLWATRSRTKQYGMPHLCP